MIEESKVKSRELTMMSKRILFFCLLISAFCLFLSCSQPVMESEQCISARDVVKKFYSFHVGNDMTPSSEYLKRREKYLSNALKEKLADEIDSKKDYFTNTEDYPKAFRAGACENVGKEKTKFEILLFWRDDETNIQRAIEVVAINENDKWLINKVTSKE